MYCCLVSLCSFSHGIDLDLGRMFEPFPESMLATRLSFAYFFPVAFASLSRRKMVCLLGTFQSSVLRGEWKKDTEALMSFGLVRVCLAPLEGDMI